MPTDLDLLRSLSDNLHRDLASSAFLKKLKTSAVKDVAKALGKKILENKKPIGAALTGAGLAGLAGYSMAKGKGSTPGSEKWVAQKFTDSAEKTKALKEQGIEPSFRQEMAQAVQPAISNVSDLLSRHPGKAALMVAPAGALAGLRIMKALK